MKKVTHSLVTLVLGASFVILWASPAAACHLATFAETAYSVSEDAGEVKITVNRSLSHPPVYNPGNCPGKIDYWTEDGSATAGTDYTSTRGTLTFGGSESSKTFSVPIIDDKGLEQSETFSAKLGNGQAIESDGSPATVTIKDNEVAPAAPSSPKPAPPAAGAPAPAGPATTPAASPPAESPPSPEAQTEQSSSNETLPSASEVKTEKSGDGTLRTIGIVALIAVILAVGAERVFRLVRKTRTTS